MQLYIADGSDYSIYAKENESTFYRFKDDATERHYVTTYPNKPCFTLNDGVQPKLLKVDFADPVASLIKQADTDTAKTWLRREAAYILANGHKNANVSRSFRHALGAIVMRFRANDRRIMGQIQYEAWLSKPPAASDINGLVAEGRLDDILTGLSDFAVRYILSSAYPRIKYDNNLTAERRNFVQRFVEVTKCDGIVIDYVRASNGGYGSVGRMETEHHAVLMTEEYLTKNGTRYDTYADYQKQIVEQQARLDDIDFDALWALRLDRTGLTKGALREEIRVGRAAMTNRLSSLQARGLVELKSAGGPLSGTKVALTDTGRTALRSRLEAMNLRNVTIN